MRYAAGRKEATRKKIVRAAARSFRRRGYGASGVDQVMKDAGLTAGGFYAHFDGKRELLAETLGLSLEQVRKDLLGGLDELRGPALLRAVVGRYLSRSHRDRPADGCSMPALAAEIAREGKGPRRALQSYLLQLLGDLAPRVPPAPGLSPEDRLLATASLLVGGMMLARAVDDEALSERILRASRRLAVPELAESLEHK